ncbi:MAG: aryl-sulfate sulfotransferase [Rikenellaceae bacterium]
MKNRLLLLLVLCFVVYSCEVEEDLSANNSNTETLEPGFQWDKTSTFSNGDVISFSDSTSIKSISFESTQADISLSGYMSDKREFVIGFHSEPSNFGFSLTLYAPDSSQDWVLYSLEDDVWVQVVDADYTEISGKYSAEVVFHADATCVDNDLKYSVGTFAFCNVLTSVNQEINPSKRNGLSALISFNSSLTVEPKMTLLGQDNNDITTSFDNAVEHSIQVLGLYNNYVNTVYIDCELNAGVTLRNVFNFRPEYPYIDAYEFDTYRSDNLRNASDMVYINASRLSSGSYSSDKDEFGHQVVSVGIDEYNKVRWVYSDDLVSEGAAFFIFPIVYKDEQLFVRYVAQLATSTTGVYLYDYAGNIIHSYPNAATDIHHEAAIGPNNLIAIPGTKSPSTTNECIIYEIDMENQTRVTALDLEDILDTDRISVCDTGYGDDWAHINAIAYSESDDCYVISARRQGVIKIKRGATDKTGIVWWLTPHYNVGDDWQQYLLEPTNFDKDDYEQWNIGQHAVSILPNGDVMMFDNHNTPLYNAASTRASRVFTVRVDEDNMQVEAINSWYTPDNYYSWYMSNAYYYPSTTSTVSGYATSNKLYEASYTDGEVLFSSHFKNVNTSSAIYRFYKLDLYK